MPYLTSFGDTQIANMYNSQAWADAARANILNKNKAATALPGTSPATGRILQGAAAREYDPAFGGIPQVTDPSSVITGTIAGNRGNLQGAVDLAAAANLAKTNQANAARTAFLPNYENLLGEASGNVLSNLQGQISPDVLATLQQAGAERGLMTGGAGGPNAGAAYLRALGLTSMDLQNRGQAQYGNLINTLPNVNLTDPNAYLLSPEQALSSQASADIFNAAPSPAAANYAGVNALNTGLGRGFSGASGYGGGYGGYVAPAVTYNAPATTASNWSETTAGAANPTGTGNYWDANGTEYTVDNRTGVVTPARDPLQDVSTQGPNWWDFQNPYGTDIGSDVGSGNEIDAYLESLYY